MNILPNQLRNYISRIRLSSHALRIETGRYGVNRVDRNQRLCLICNENDIEDEFHFIFVCNRYDRIRNLYLRTFYYIRPSMHKMVLLFQRKSPKILFDLAKYIKYALETKNNYINNLKN